MYPVLRRSRLWLMAVVALLAAWCGLVGTAQAGLDISVNLATQTMRVSTDDGDSYQWKVSSGAKGYRTPAGLYRPYRLEKKWYSRKYGGNMPHAVFFRGGYAIHGTGAISRLGSPASHGCIRLHPANAAKLFALVQKHGRAGTRIALNGVAPDSGSQFARLAPRTHVAKAARPTQGAKIQLAKAKAKPGVPTWENARDILELRPSLPPAAYGYQPSPRLRPLR